MTSPTWTRSRLNNFLRKKPPINDDKDKISDLIDQCIYIACLMSTTPVIWLYVENKDKVKKMNSKKKHKTK